MAANVSRPFECGWGPASFYGVLSFTVANLLLLPLCLYILHSGFSQWKLRHVASHLDHFTFHTAAMELMPICGCVVFCVGAFYRIEALMELSATLFCPNWSAKIHFNTLSCVERYLAVVHPITYLGLKKRGGVMIRNISIAFLWFLALVWPAFNSLTYEAQGVVFLFSLGVAFVIIIFCNISVLYVLLRPSPAKGGASKVKVDQSKKKAFQILSVISGALFVALFGLLVSEILSLHFTLAQCIMLSVALWFTFPCSLVLPLLYLHRTCK